MTSMEIITPKMTSGRWDHHHRSPLVLEARLTIITLYGNLAAKHWLVNPTMKLWMYDRPAHAGSRAVSTNDVSSKESGVNPTGIDPLAHPSEQLLFPGTECRHFYLFFYSFFCSYSRLMVIMGLVFGTFLPFFFSRSRSNILLPFLFDLLSRG